MQCPRYNVPFRLSHWRPGPAGSTLHLEFSRTVKECVKLPYTKVSPTGAEFGDADSYYTLKCLGLYHAIKSFRLIFYPPPPIGHFCPTDRLVISDNIHSQWTWGNGYWFSGSIGKLPHGISRRCWISLAELLTDWCLDLCLTVYRLIRCNLNTVCTMYSIVRISLVPVNVITACECENEKFKLR